MVILCYGVSAIDVCVKPLSPKHTDKHSPFYVSIVGLNISKGFAGKSDGAFVLHGGCA